MINALCKFSQRFPSKIESRPDYIVDLYTILYEHDGALVMLGRYRTLKIFPDGSHEWYTSGDRKRLFIDVIHAVRKRMKEEGCT